MKTNHLTDIFYQDVPAWKQYNELIQNAVNREYENNINTEKKYHIHHIVPKCYFKYIEPQSSMVESPYNKVKLTVNEHVKAHELLSKCLKHPYLRDRMEDAAVLLKKDYLTDWIKD